MDNLKRAAGVAMLIQAAQFLWLLLFLLVLLPQAGFASPAALNDPAKALPFAATSPFPSILFLVTILWAVTVAIPVLALYERLRTHSPGVIAIATTFGLMVAVLFLARGILGFSGLPVLANLFAQNPTEVGPAYLAVNTVLSALAASAVFAYGVWLLLTNWVALKSAALPRLHGYLGLIFGGAGVLGFLIPPLTLLGAVLGVVWTLWLGIVLLRA